MRIIRIARNKLDPPNVGRSLVIPVIVDWPELQLTEAQIQVNAMAEALGKLPPYPDHSFFQLEIY